MMMLDNKGGQEGQESGEKLSDYNWSRTQNNLVQKRKLNHLAKLRKSGYIICECSYVIHKLLSI